MVDATQGVEPQTLANAYLAIESDHEIIPVLNKIDLPAAEPERIATQIEEVIGLDAASAVKISAKSGLGVPDLLEAIVARLPAPVGDRRAPLKALLVDSWYDPYLGVMILVRIKDGVLKKGMKIRMMAAGTVHQVEQVGGTIRLGQATVTDDAEGDVTASVGAVGVERDAVVAAAAAAHRRHRAGAERGQRDQGQGGARLPPGAQRRERRAGRPAGHACRGSSSATPRVADADGTPGARRRRRGHRVVGHLRAGAGA